jgi:hypothetical protein
MRRAFVAGALLITLAIGCKITEREGQEPLAENAPPLAYAEMITRARGQAGAALDAFYIDSWMELEQAAQRLEQSARLLPKSKNIPDGFKEKIEPESEQLRKDALQLIDAARTQNAGKANEAMQRINQRIRQLRPAEKLEK